MTFATGHGNANTRNAWRLTRPRRHSIFVVLWVSGFGDEGLEVGLKGVRCRVYGVGCRVRGAGCKV